jgi:hypothetical protein
LPDTAVHTLLKGVANDWFDPTDSHEHWPQKRCKVHLTSKQEEIRRSVRRNRYTAVVSAHDMGKSFMASLMACEWIDTHELGDAFVVTTAPTSPQVTAIIWREIEQLHRAHGLPGRIVMGRIPEWKVGSQQVAYGRKPSDYDDSGFQGIHETYILIIVDEAEGIPEQLWEAIDALATNINARVLAIGNPGDPNCHFRKICMPGGIWNVIHLDGLLSPNFNEDEVKAASLKRNDEGNLVTGDLHSYMIDNNIPFSTEKVPYELQVNLLSPLWVAERMVKYSIARREDGTWTTDPRWEARVRGEWADNEVSGVIPRSWVLLAVERWKEWQESDLPVEKLVGARAFGVDTAGEGDDETCVSERVGYTCLYVEREGMGNDTQTPAHRVAERMRRRGGRAVVDYNGQGQGTADRLIEEGYEVIKFIAQGRTDATDTSGEYTFVNNRSCAWWNMRELLDPQSSIPVALPDDEQLISDLTSPRYVIRTGAKIYVEDKKETKKRLGRSPDTGDSVIMDFWMAGLGAEGTAFITKYTDGSALIQRYGASRDSITGATVVQSPVFEEAMMGPSFDEPKWDWND